MSYVWRYIFFSFSTILKKKVVLSNKSSQSDGITKWKKGSGYPKVTQYAFKYIKIGYLKSLFTLSMSKTKHGDSFET